MPPVAFLPWLPCHVTVHSPVLVVLRVPEAKCSLLKGSAQSPSPCAASGEAELRAEDPALNLLFNPCRNLRTIELSLAGTQMQ